VFLMTSKGFTQENSLKAQALFTELKKDNLVILKNHYDENATFIDPLGTHQGLDTIESYYKKLYDGVEEINFEYPQVIEKDKTVVLFWVMRLKSKALSKDTIKVSGVSQIEYGENGKIIFQRDYFDSAELFYKNIPIIGSLIRFIEKKIKK
jgi:limonene-1,2-epoxide hydrolase